MGIIINVTIIQNVIEHKTNQRLHFTWIFPKCSLVKLTKMYRLDLFS